MYSLIQIILILNSAEVPNINVLTHFDNLKACEIKLYEALKRNLEGENNAQMITDNENNKLLKIEFDNEETISYWYCKQTIFYK